MTTIHPESRLLVLLQLVLILAFLLTAPWIADGVWLWMQSIAVATGFWALFTLPKKQWQVWPEPTEQGHLIDTGPYRWIRHPMYTAVLLFFLALTLNDIHIINVCLWLALTLTLLLKIHREEHCLLTTFPRYATYQQRTQRLIPYLY